MVISSIVLCPATVIIGYLVIAFICHRWYRRCYEILLIWPWPHRNPPCIKVNETSVD